MAWKLKTARLNTVELGLATRREGGEDRSSMKRSLEDNDDANEAHYRVLSGKAWKGNPGMTFWAVTC